MTDNYKILLDVPLTPNSDDVPLALGHESLSLAFKQVIEHSDPQFAIGLFGGWGSGKTTLMHAIEQKLNPATCATIWFSAWRYEKEEHLIVPLLDVIREGIVAWADRNTTTRQKARKTALGVAGTIGKAIGVLLAGFSVKTGIPGVIDIKYEANRSLADAAKLKEDEANARMPRSFYHASFAAMRDAFAAFTEDGARRIVIFVDDLDRCLPEGTLEVLESMKLFFDLPGFVFVVGVDRRIVEMSIEKRYREMLPPREGANLHSVSANGDDRDGGEMLPSQEAGNRHADIITGGQYLRKIFQVPYGLAPVSAAQINEFLSSIESHSDLPADQWAEFNDTCRPHLRYLVDDAGVNPREVKRYLNSYTLVRKINPDLKPDVILALQTIAFRPDWAEIQLALLAFRDVLLDALVREVDEPGVGHLGTVWPALETPPASFLTYVSTAGPGNALYANAKEGDFIDEYLFSGEATRSSQGSNFVHVFRALGESVLQVRVARENDKDSKEILSRLRQAKSVLFSDTSESASSFAGIQRELESLMREINESEWDSVSGKGTKPGDTEAVKRKREIVDRLSNEWVGRIRTVISTLQELYRAGLT